MLPKEKYQQIENNSFVLIWQLTTAKEYKTWAQMIETHSEYTTEWNSLEEEFYEQGGELYIAGNYETEDGGIEVSLFIKCRDQQSCKGECEKILAYVESYEDFKFKNWRS
jgi:hypothetical protein